MYAIRGIAPRTDIQMGAHGFCIHLHPSWPALVAQSKITAEHLRRRVREHAESWLDACGYNRMTEFEGKKERLYRAESIRVKWGPWGLEHIDVPGNACGLDIDVSGFGNLFKGGAQLQPHNIDSWSQKKLLLCVFCEIAEDIIVLGREAVGL